LNALRESLTALVSGSENGLGPEDT
jgi:hypothetical protein